MRTREEQIAQLKYFFNNLCPDLQPSGKQALAAVAKNFIEEAEQRVRAEIARDSERLDWIGMQDVVIGEYGGTPQWENVLLARYQRTLPADLLDIRVTIDRARENAND